MSESSVNQPAGGRVLPTPSSSHPTSSSADAASGGPRSSGFADLGLPKTLVKALAREGIVEPTPIQQAVLPSALAGRNVLGRARTGSGKTLSFGLPVLDQLAGGTRRPKAPRGLILVPTRELATQVQRALAPLAAPLHLRIMTVLGGTPINKQIHQLRDGVDLVVATPGRLADLVDRRACCSRRRSTATSTASCGVTCPSTTSTRSSRRRSRSRAWSTTCS